MEDRHEEARHEFKHNINFMDYTILRSRLKAVLPRDPHAGETGEYVVHSLYFDTPRDKALREKIDGVNSREKFRIRRYEENTENLRLEKKSKRNGLCYKKSESLTKAEVEAILENDIAWMARDERPLVMELYSKMRGQLLRPKTIVDYIREPYIYPAGNVRITIDRDIRTGLYSTDFLRTDTPVIPTEQGLIVLEVKYDAFIPQFIVNLIQVGDRRASACSKYALCRIYG